MRKLVFSTYIHEGRILTLGEALYIGWTGYHPATVKRSYNAMVTELNRYKDYLPNDRAESLKFWVRHLIYGIIITSSLLFLAIICLIK